MKKLKLGEVMKRLETVYLANVILYLPSIESIIKFKLLNKKCQDATNMIRIYRSLKMNERDSDKLKFIPNNLFEIFPNVETIECDWVEMQNKKYVFNDIKQIKFKIPGDEVSNTKFFQSIKNKIISLHICNCWKLQNISLNEYPRVKKVKVDCSSLNIQEFLGKNDLFLDQLILKTSNCPELDELKNYKNIENKVLIIENELTKERYEELKMFSVVKSLENIKGVDLKERMFNFVCDEGLNIEGMYQLSLFKKCDVRGNCDFRTCENLEIIDGGSCTASKILFIKIEGLKNLKTIKYVENVDCIPSSVTNMLVYEEFCFDSLLEKDRNCFSNIKELNLRSTYNKQFNESLLTHFVKCERLSIELPGEENKAIEFPPLLNKLKIDCCSEEQVKLLYNLKNLKKLTFNIGCGNLDNEKTQNLLNNLTCLEHLCLVSNNLDKIIVPNNITSLKIHVGNDLNLVRYNHLEQISIISRDSRLCCNVSLPKLLNKLRIVGDFNILNVTEIEINTLVLLKTNCNNLKWKFVKTIIE